MMHWTILRSYGLQLKSTKCHLFRTSVPFLGHVVGRSGLECDPKKIEYVKSWPVPDSLNSVRQFLGFVGYYRRFIPSFADLAEPLVALIYNSSSSLLYTAPVTTMATLMACLELQPPLVVNVPVATALRWTRPWWLLINPLTLSLWATQRMPTSFLYSPVKIGWHSWMMICPVRPLSLAKSSVSPPYNLKTQPVSRHWSGSGLILFLHGRR